MGKAYLPDREKRIYQENSLMSEPLLWLLSHKDEDGRVRSNVQLLAYSGF